MLLDDGYYYLQIAWHISEGHGTTFDGINFTNGYYPLWLLLLVPLFWTGMGKEFSLYAVTILQTGLFIFSGWLLYLVLRRMAGIRLAVLGA